MAIAHPPSPAVPDRPDGAAEPTHHLRTIVLAVAVSLAAAATAVVPLVLRDHGRTVSTVRTPTPVTSPASRPTLPGGSLVGDVDGDGAADTVTLSARHLLTVSLGSGRDVRQLLQDRPRLVGLADVGGPGLAVVTSARRRQAHDLTAWTLRGDRLERLPTRQDALLTDEPGIAAAWVSDETLFDGVLDPLQRGADQVVVVSRAWHLRGGTLTPTGAGIRCWARSEATLPAPCPIGSSFAFDVGAHGDLPTLLPPAPSIAAGDHGVVTGNRDRWFLHRVTPSGPPDSATYDLVVSGRGATRTVRIPAGWTPVLGPTPVSVGELTDGVLVSQEGGDSDTWRVYVDWAGGIEQLVTRGSVPLGGGFSPNGDAAYVSWQGADGRLYTRLGTSTPGRFRVWAWQPTAATASTPPTLVARGLGVVCIDDLLQTYGTCPLSR